MSMVPTAHWIAWDQVVRIVGERGPDFEPTTTSSSGLPLQGVTQWVVNLRCWNFLIWSTDCFLPFSSINSFNLVDRSWKLETSSWHGAQSQAKTSVARQGKKHQNFLKIKLPVSYQLLTSRWRLELQVNRERFFLLAVKRGMSNMFWQAGLCDSAISAAFQAPTLRYKDSYQIGPSPTRRNKWSKDWRMIFFVFQYDGYIYRWYRCGSNICMFLRVALNEPQCWFPLLLVMQCSMCLLLFHSILDGSVLPPGDDFEEQSRISQAGSKDVVS